MGQALFFVTHLFDANIEKRLKKLLSETDGLCDVYIATNKPDVIPEHYRDRVRTWSIEEMRERNKCLISTGYLGNCHMTPLIVRDKIPHYEYYWFIEYDVVYTGNWRDIISLCMSDTADLIATHIKTYRADSEWSWWKHLKTGHDCVDNEAKIKGFFPVYRISRSGIDALEESIRRGWSGHFESLIPTAIHFQHGILHELGGDSLFTPSERRGCFYTLPKFDSHAGEFRYRPYHIFCPKKNTLYHPVKTSFLSSLQGEFWGGKSGSRSSLRDGNTLTDLQRIYYLLRSWIQIPVGYIKNISKKCRYFFSKNK